MGVILEFLPPPLVWRRQPPWEVANSAPMGGKTADQIRQTGYGMRAKRRCRAGWRK